MVSEDSVSSKKKKLSEKKGLVSEDKINTDCSEWGHSIEIKKILWKEYVRTFLKRKTKDNQRKKV